MISTHSLKAIHETAANVLGKQRKKKLQWVTYDTLDLYDKRRELKKEKKTEIGSKEHYRIPTTIPTGQK